LEFVNTYLPRCTTVSLVSIEKEKEIVYGEREREREREIVYGESSKKVVVTL
jgi:hypothetical protein